jgi:hypothetical protein
MRYIWHIYKYILRNLSVIILIGAFYSNSKETPEEYHKRIKGLLVKKLVKVVLLLAYLLYESGYLARLYGIFKRFLVLLGLSSDKPKQDCESSDSEQSGLADSANPDSDMMD